MSRSRTTALAKPTASPKAMTVAKSAAPPQPVPVTKAPPPAKTTAPARKANGAGQASASLATPASTT
jgi:hypothetical protein